MSGFRFGSIDMASLKYKILNWDNSNITPKNYGSNIEVVHKQYFGKPLTIIFLATNCTNGH